VTFIHPFLGLAFQLLFKVEYSTGRCPLYAFDGSDPFAPFHGLVSLGAYRMEPESTWLIFLGSRGGFGNAAVFRSPREDPICRGFFLGC